jgi:hypothetical protein
VKGISRMLIGFFICFFNSLKATLVRTLTMCAQGIHAQITSVKTNNYLYLLLTVDCMINLKGTTCQDSTQVLL